ncbi:MAG: hypothetical protein AB8B63_18825 [Granulosicoccus sp.]
MTRKKYQKRERQVVTGVQLDLETDGFIYRKWGADQRCQSGDWLVNNNGDVYTIGQQSFADTYQELEPGRYVKVAPVWAHEADKAGSVKTNEGSTDYQAGDYIVSNRVDGSDSYAVSKDKFEAMYEEVG